MILYRESLISWHDFPKTHRLIKGVYLIGTYYIGASKGIKKRVKDHVRNAISDYNAGRNLCKLKTKIIQQLITYGSINVYFMDNDPYKEYDLYLIFEPECNNTKQGKFYHQQFKKQQ
jgi:hypothetical protein